MCTHVSLTARNGHEIGYPNMDCSLGHDGKEKCKLSDKTIAHLMASGQFKKIEISLERELNGSFAASEKTNAELDKDGWNDKDIYRTFEERDFPAFIERVLGAQAMQERHHAPEKIGVAVR